jgi:hypothetical protein
MNSRETKGEGIGQHYKGMQGSWSGILANLKEVARNSSEWEASGQEYLGMKKLGKICRELGANGQEYLGTREN